MLNQKHNIVIDTNLWISFLLTGKLTDLDTILKKTQAIVLFSETLLSEFLEVAQRPKFNKYFSVSDLNALLNRIHEIASFVDVKSEVTISPDPKDNFLLSLCKDGKATHLLTGDKALLNLNTFGKTKIITFSAYLAEI
ncbi:putative toxin-antitoxin system toxin component, PIN family [Pedobacter sp. HMF7647]|uniref:Putative toxin-antitoxin system toxin component, PIN family n=1 Tax=Hufsiella arboris TaxID=2695275 RepID=A0A7K1YAE1_9SPHI|nr:putative toxin-antitoxin system toxin component, PIN family [Hufsiella arboris]MXV51542.1 putative toxin-antitoxin system toxin component, PIN family [Hufsiella arboris]